MKYCRKENGSVLSQLHRFFVEPSLVSATMIFIPKEEAIHIFGSFRYKVGDMVEFFDGHGNVYVTKLIARDKAEIVDKRYYPDVPYRIVVAQSILKAKKMDFVVKRLTELGVYGMIPILTEYSIGSFTKERMERWRKLSIESAKQSRNPFILHIWDTMEFDEFLAVRWDSCSVKFFLDVFNEDAEPIKSFLRRHSGNISFLGVVGPEGGFSNLERSRLRDAGFVPVVIRGDLVFRSEIASLLLGGMFLYEYRN